MDNKKVFRVAVIASLDDRERLPYDVDFKPSLTVHNFSSELVKQKSDDLTACLSNKNTQIILVTNEVGMGIIPSDPLSRTFQGHLGRLNREVASVANALYMMVSGVPLQIK